MGDMGVEVVAETESIFEIPDEIQSSIEGVIEHASKKR
jgi:hypothetical protein